MAHSTLLARRLRSAPAPWQVVLGLALVYLAAVFALNAADPLTFVTLGACYAACQGVETCDPEVDAGYDGQFAYYIARDPLHAAPCLDVPAYRYQRILLPLLGRALALGDARWLPLALVAVNLTALVAATAALERLLTAQRVSRWYALVFGLFVGVFMGVRLSTTEPLAYGLVVAAVWLHARGRAGLGAAAFLLAALAKETTLAFAAGYGLSYLLAGRWRAALRLALVVGAPFALWQAALYLWLGAFGVGSGGALNSPFEVIPFNGFWRVAYDPTGSPRVFLVMSIYTLPAVILPAVWGLWQAGRDLWRGLRHPYAACLAVNALVLAAAPFSTYREPLGILRFMVGLVLSFLLYAALRFPGRRPLRYTPVWLALSVYLAAG